MVIHFLHQQYAEGRKLNYIHMVKFLFVVPYLFDINSRYISCPIYRVYINCSRLTA